MASSLTWTLPTTWTPTSVAAASAERLLTDAALSGLDEPSLVAACLAGQPHAFDLIVERHRRPVYQLCYRYVGNHEDASDLAQDVFVRAYRGLRNFRGQSSLATWLYRIAVNVCLNRIATKTPHMESIAAHQFVDVNG